jgi:tRNA(Ile)-lysidine synthase
MGGERRPPTVARVLERVTKTAREHRMFEHGDTVLVCVSGGPDSVCLLESLIRVRRIFRIRLEIFHFDHALRDASHRDAAYVRRRAGLHDVPFHVRRAVDEPAFGHSVEAWAAAARMNAADDVRREIGAAVMAEGHTLDDQAETVLLNIVRGTGLEGAAGIAPGTREHGIVQPLLAVTRRDVEAYCRALGLRPRRDPMNEDRRFLRAAIRHDVLPAIERATGREVRSSIARTAELLQADLDELRSAAILAYRDVATHHDEHEVRFAAGRLAALPPPVATRVVRLAIYRVLSSDWAAPWTKPAIDAVLDLARGRPGRHRDLPNGSTAVREREYVRVSLARPSSGGSSDRTTKEEPCT